MTSRNSQPSRIVHAVIAACILALVGIGAWQNRIRRQQLVAITARPQGIMGTECLLTVVAPRGRSQQARAALQAAEAALRRVEALMSTWLDDSPVSIFNRAEPGIVALPQPVMAVLRASKRMADLTDGAFDVTCRPLIELWRRAGKQGRLPTPDQLAQARAASRWNDLELLDHAVRKRKQSARVDLGGIAKGYGIDRAVEAMRAAGVAGGMVDVGGDIRCFGVSSNGKGWMVGVRNPFTAQKQVWVPLRVPDGAVCTSGPYARFIEIEGVRYSHIIDPRSGRPAQSVPSVTVIAPDATTADSWATALSVLGPPGLKMLPPGQSIQVLLVTGTAQRHRVFTTSGFQRFVAAATAPGAPIQDNLK